MRSTEILRWSLVGENRGGYGIAQQFVHHSQSRRERIIFENDLVAEDHREVETIPDDDSGPGHRFPQGSLNLQPRGQP